MEVLVLLFILLSAVVLGLLCLLVLEYENLRLRRWSRLWSEELQPTPSRLRPVRSSGSPWPEPAFFLPKALDVARPLS